MGMPPHELARQVHAVASLPHTFPAPPSPHVQKPARKMSRALWISCDLGPCFASKMWALVKSACASRCRRLFPGMKNMESNMQGMTKLFSLVQESMTRLLNLWLALYLPNFRDFHVFGTASRYRLQSHQHIRVECGTKTCISSCLTRYSLHNLTSIKLCKPGHPLLYRILLPIEAVHPASFKFSYRCHRIASTIQQRAQQERYQVYMTPCTNSANNCAACRLPFDVHREGYPSPACIHALVVDTL